MCLYPPRTIIRLHSLSQRVALPTDLTCCSPCITRRQQNMTRSWPKTGGRMLRVSWFWCVPRFPSTLGFNAHRTSLEWFDISYSWRIPFSVLPGLSDELSRCLGLLSWPDIPTSGQFEQFYWHPATEPPKAGIRAHRGKRVLVRESGDESCLRRVRDLGTRMGPQILALDSTTVQPT